MQARYNPIALAAGICAIILIVVSILVPWWTLTLGSPAVFTTGLSPVKFSMDILGDAITIPIIVGLNAASIALLALGATTMIIYGIRPLKPYSKRLMSYGYTMPLFAIVLFIAEIAAVIGAASAIGSFSIPVMGSTTLQLPYSENVSVSIEAATAFQWTFIFAIVTAALALSTRLYHRRIATATASGKSATKIDNSAKA
ncbi:MAG: hypothetical protein NWF05_07340 [Candidatus Bathyarchaeota archaeon]|nr:hypothetical protein [Candidatus Bathyarchaeota archaeon]